MSILLIDKIDTLLDMDVDDIDEDDFDTVLNTDALFSMGKSVSAEEVAEIERIYDKYC
jgi:hypothetical protein